MVRRRNAHLWIVPILVLAAAVGGRVATPPSAPVADASKRRRQPCPLSSGLSVATSRRAECQLGWGAAPVASHDPYPAVADRSAPRAASSAANNDGRVARIRSPSRWSMNPPNIRSEIA